MVPVAATVFTITDIPLQYYHYSPMYGSNVGQNKSGWSAVGYTLRDGQIDDYLYRAKISGEDPDDLWLRDKFFEGGR